MDVPLWAWAAVVGVILAMLAIDLFAHRDRPCRRGQGGRRLVGGLGHARTSAFGAVIWSVYGGEFGQQYFAGYLIEKSLAVDNVFVFAMIFAYFAVPREYQHRVLFYGVLGALVFRGVFIAAGSVLIASFAWVLYLFGAFLVLHRHQDGPARATSTSTRRKPCVLRLFSRCVPTTDDYHGQRFLVRAAGALRGATPLLAVLVIVEVTDIVFAVDSIPAIFAVTQEPFLVFTATPSPSWACGPCTSCWPT